VSSNFGKNNIIMLCDNAIFLFQASCFIRVFEKVWNNSDKPGILQRAANVGGNPVVE